MHKHTHTHTRHTGGKPAHAYTHLTKHIQTKHCVSRVHACVGCVCVVCGVHDWKSVSTNTHTSFDGSGLSVLFSCNPIQPSELSPELSICTCCVWCVCVCVCVCACVSMDVCMLLHMNVNWVRGYAAFVCGAVRAVC